MPKFTITIFISHLILTSLGRTRSGGLISHDNTIDGMRPDRGATLGIISNLLRVHWGAIYRSERR